MKKRLLGIFVGILAVLVLAVVALSLLAQPVPEHPFFASLPERPLVIAHQGGDGLWPSNTMYAMEQAEALGVDVLEMDIHATSGGVLVLSHDETVDRLTDGTGLIREMSLEEVQALDAGYQWNKDPERDYPYRGQGIIIPTLEEVLVAFPERPMVIEIKQQEPSIVEPFCQMIQRYNRENLILVASFHPETMVEFREACPDVATSATEQEIRPFFALNRLFLDSVYQLPAEAFQVPEYSGGLHVVTKQFVEGAHRHNVDIHVWTVNETEDMRRLLALGVDGIITDHPDRMLALLNQGE